MFRTGMTGIVCSGILLVFSNLVTAKIVTKDVEYRDGNTVLQGFLAYDDSSTGKRPGVLIVHEYFGLGDYEKKRAQQLAGLGYTALCADIYGKGVRAKNDQEAAKLAGMYRADRQLMRRRAAAGLNELKKQDTVDGTKTAAIGYCFGGTVVLELARSGADIAGVASFHGNYDTPNLQDAKNIKARLLVLHGANDPTTSNDVLLGFMKEMRDAKVDWQMNIYGSAVHRFTNPAAGDDSASGYAYNAEADRRSWDALQLFFNGIFKE